MGWQVVTGDAKFQTEGTWIRKRVPWPEAWEVYDKLSFQEGDTILPHHCLDGCSAPEVSWNLGSQWVETMETGIRVSPLAPSTDYYLTVTAINKAGLADTVTKTVSGE